MTTAAFDTVKDMRFVVFILVTLGLILPTHAQNSLLGQEKRVLSMTKGSWAHFRNFNGQQLIYFTHLESYRCGLTKVQYSLNGDTLDRVWKLQPCDPAKPHHITTDRPYITLALGTARSISIRLTFEDGSTSEVVRVSSDNQLMNKARNVIEGDDARPVPAMPQR